MPFAPVNDQGAQLFFKDTGAPPGSPTYPTLVLVHGTVFHSDIFALMFPFVAANHFRLVMRDYPKSTPYSATELAVIQSGDFTSRSAFIAARGVEIAAFLEWFIKEHDIPPLSVVAGADGTGDIVTGGVSVSGWSYGNAIILSFLAHADKLSGQTRDFLESYLRTYIIYDAPCYAFGIPYHPELYSPLRDSTLTPKQTSEQFALWVSSYYAYSPRILSHLDSFNNMKEIITEMAKIRDPITDPPLHQTPTLLRMSAEEIASCADTEGGPRSHVPLLITLNREVYSANTHDALVAPKAWLRMRTVAVWCDMSICDCVLAAAHLTEMLKMWPSTGRKVEVRRMEGTNHFAHWESPESTVQYFASIV
ncbi:hypothetical protein B0H21DRAFT_860599 [Amylocystis lapponica]|nr:hypothetical protein B0H21DRAFT_860599 [Amylocystis lapponica]